MKASLFVVTVLFASLLLPTHAGAAGSGNEKGPGAGMTLCRMTFDLKGWSAFYKTASGSGTITCDNGQSAKVAIEAKGGGITFGKSEMIGGTGKFTEAKNIEELFGSYAQAEAHAGAGKSSDAQALTKGEVSLTLTAKGRGVDVGFAFGKFTITKVQ